MYDNSLFDNNIITRYLHNCEFKEGEHRDRAFVLS